MTITQAQAESLYNQVLDLQTVLVRRGELAPTAIHEIVDSIERAEFGSVWVQCACGHWTSFKDDDAERGERLYATHVADSIGFKVRLGRAA